MNFKNVLILTQYYLPEKGAPQIRLSKMANVLTDNNINVSVLTGFPNYPEGITKEGYKNKLSMKESIENIEINRVWLYPASGKNKIKRLFNYLSFTFTATLKIFFLPKPDLIFVEGQPLTLAFPALIYKYLRGVPYIYNTPDLQVEYAKDDNWLPAFFPWVAARLEKFFMHQSLSVTTVTHAFVNYFSEKYDVSYKKISFLPNGADTKNLYPEACNHSYKNKMGVSAKYIFTYCGTMAPYQGLDIIINAAERLKHRDDIEILMIGDGPIRNEIINLAKLKDLKNVIFNNSPISETKDLMSITFASLVVLRALEISKKMRLSKAIPPLACGVPVIFSGWGETANIINENNAGIVIEPENHELLASKIEFLADNPNLRESFSKSARKLAIREFDWTNIIENWMLQIDCIYNDVEPQIKGLIKK